MPEFLKLTPPADALALYLDSIPKIKLAAEMIDTINALDRVTAESIVAPHPMPPFSRSAVDGYAVCAADTFGASDSLPGYLDVVGEIPMGVAAPSAIRKGQALLIHTGGMLPDGANAVVMLEYTQQSRAGEIEVLRPVSAGENVLKLGEDVRVGQEVLPSGKLVRAAEIGGLMAIGVTKMRVVNYTKAGIISTGNEIINPNITPKPGQIRDINSYSLSAIIQGAGGKSIRYGIAPDDMDALKTVARKAHQECDLVIITAGSSASARDMTAEVIQSLGEPGILVHGVNVRPGKPTILGLCEGKPVIGLPGNPVSALVIAQLFVVPVIRQLQGLEPNPPKSYILAKLTANVPSQAGREDWVPVKLSKTSTDYLAEPIFSKSNLIFSLVQADGLLRIPADATGMPNGETVEIYFL